MSCISENIALVRENIAKAAAGRPVKLLAVSKTFPVSMIEEAVRVNQFCFGENYAQEGSAKVDYFSEHFPGLKVEWHFIGPLQSNKTRLVAQRFKWVQSIDRLKIALRLNEQRPKMMAPLNILVEVNIDDEKTKSGVRVDELSEFLPQLVNLSNLRLRGLMCIPRADADDERKRETFRAMKRLFDQCDSQGYAMDTLSMGMSADYMIAIEEGATLVRVGSSIFGARNYSK